MKTTPLPVPHGVFREIQPGRLVIRWSWRHNGKIIAMVGFTLVWNLIMFAWCYQTDIKWRALSMNELFPLLFVGIGFFLGYRCLGALLNTTVVAVGPQSVRVTSGPVPWHRARVVNALEIRNVIYREKASRGYDSVYRVLAVRSDGTETKLITGLTNYEVTVFQVREIRAALDLPDVALSPDA